MIQRIQTLYLALASLFGFSIFLAPMDFAKVHLGDQAQEGLAMLADGIFDVKDHVIVLVFAVLIGLIPLVTIFLFKNRALQSSIARIAIVLSILLVLLAVFFFYQDYQNLSANTPVEIGFGILSPIFTIIFLLLANNRIRKDEKIVKSSNRLR